MHAETKMEASEAVNESKNPPWPSRLGYVAECLECVTEPRAQASGCGAIPLRFLSDLNCKMLGTGLLTHIFDLCEISTPGIRSLTLPAPFQEVCMLWLFCGLEMYNFQVPDFNKTFLKFHSKRGLNDPGITG